jgi:hypothetical protein
MSSKISSVRFGVFVQGRGLHDWEWESIELLRGRGATGLFIIAPSDGTAATKGGAGLG